MNIFNARNSFLLKISVLAVFFCTVIGQQCFVYCQSIKQVMDKAVVDVMKDKNIPGAIVGVWSESNGTWIKAFGKSDIAAGKAMNYKNKFRIGGVTQTFLVTLLLELVEQRKIGLDDKLVKYLPFVKNAENITIRQLADNTSGIFNYMDDSGFQSKVLQNPLKEWQPVELLNFAFSHPPYFAPGKGWHYSDTNFILIGMIIEQITSYKIDEIIKNKIINRIGLSNTVFSTNPYIFGDYAHGYLSRGGNDLLEDVTLTDPSVMWAAGAIVSDLDDLALWAKALSEGRLLTDKATYQRFKWTDTNDSYLKNGLGVFKMGDFVGYASGIFGYSCLMYYCAKEDFTIIVILNKFPDDGAAISIFKSLTKIIIPDSVPW